MLALSDILAESASIRHLGEEFERVDVSHMTINREDVS